jgi:hypothetical protein
MKADDKPQPFDADMVRFMARLMAGYESAHRTVVDSFQILAKRAEQAEAIASRAIEMQLRLAEEREELLSKRQHRDLEAKVAAQRQESVAQLSTDVRTLLMLTGKKFLGVPLSGNDSHGLQDLLKSFSSDQIDELMSSGQLQLSVAQRHLLASTLSSMAELPPIAEDEPAKAAE